jgi:hypothetical protein
MVLSLGLYRYSGDPRSERVDLTAVEQLGYRAFVRVERETIVAVDCVMKVEPHSYRTHFGPIVESWLRQVRLLRKRKQVAGKPFELRALLVQPYHLTFFWVARPSEEEDLFLPTKEASGATRPQKLLTRSEVEALVQQSVSRYAEMETRRAKLRDRK